VRRACRHLGTCAAVKRWQATDFEQLEPERLDLREHSVERGLVAERSRQHSVAAARPSLEGGERGAHRLAQATADADTVPVRRRVAVCTGHILTDPRSEPPAGGCTVIGTCMVALLIRRILTASLGADRVSGHRMIGVISGDDQRLYQEDVSVPRAGASAGARRGGRRQAGNKHPVRSEY
jgi:hypothetical protein